MVSLIFLESWLRDLKKDLEFYSIDKYKDSLDISPYYEKVIGLTKAIIKIKKLILEEKKKENL